MTATFQRAVDRLNEPFRRGVFGRGIGLGQFSVMILSLSSATMLTNALGFPFWWLAARFFTPEAVGLSGAAISAMSLLGSASALGLGALLVRELPRHVGHESHLIKSAGAATLVSSLVLGLAFIVVSMVGGGDLAPLLQSPLAAAVFIGGVSAMGLSIIADASFMGLLRGELNFGRNALMAFGKLVLLGVLGGLAGAGGLTAISGSWMAIYSVWAVATLASLILMAALAGFLRILPRRSSEPPPSMMGFLPSAAGQFALNLTLQVPTLGMPILAVTIGGAATGAQFYIAWLLASMATIVPYSITSTLYAVGARAPEALRRQTQLTLVLSSATAVAAVAGLIVLGGPLLSMFGSGYAGGGQLLTLLALTSLPTVVKNHFHVLLRIRDRLRFAVAACGAGAVAELIAAYAGYRMGGFTGLSIAWLAAVSIESAGMAWTIPGLVAARRPSSGNEPPAGEAA